MTDKEVTDFLIDDYVSSKGLMQGARLPPLRALAEQLGRDEGAVLEALQAAEKRLKVVHDGEVWSVAFATVTDHHPFSFTQSAATHHHKLETDVLEADVRLPKEDDPFAESERAAKGSS